MNYHHHHSLERTVVRKSVTIGDSVLVISISVTMGDQFPVPHVYIHWSCLLQKTCICVDVCVHAHVQVFVYVYVHALGYGCRHLCRSVLVVAFQSVPHRLLRGAALYTHAGPRG